MRLLSLTDHQQLVFIIQLVVIVLAAQTLGRVAERFGQPPVVGQLLAGVVLGPSVLGKVWPGGFTWLMPPDRAQGGLLAGLGWVGAALVLLLTGFDTDLARIRRLGRAAGNLALGGLVLPFAAGLGLAVILPSGFIGPHGGRSVFIIFFAIAFSISSLPVIARVLTELGFVHRNFGQLTLAVGMVNDLIGWLALGLLAAVVRTGSMSATDVVVAVGGTVALLLGAFTVGQRAVNGVLRLSRRRRETPTDPLAVTLIVTLAAAGLAQLAGSEAIMGAFIAGIVLARSPFMHPKVREHLESITLSVFAPIFFATAGLRIDLSSLTSSSMAFWSVVILVVAVLTKVAGALIGARLGGIEQREGLAVGIGISCRGAVEIVIASVGLSLGVIHQSAYTAVVVLAVVTSMMAPPLLRAVVRDRPAPARATETEVVGVAP